MAWVVLKQHSQQSLTIGVEPKEAVHVTRYIVSNDDPAYVGTGEDSWNVFSSIRLQTAPFNAIKPIGARLASGSVDSGLAQFIVVDIRVETHPDRANTYEVTSTARAPVVGVAPYRGLKTSYESSFRNTAMYIKPGASFPTDGDKAWPATTIISGGLVSNIMGTPLQYAVPQRILRVEFLVHDPSSLGYTNPPTVPQTHLNKRNSASAFGFDPGTLRFAGYERRYVSDQVSMDAYTFIWDEWYHLEQIPMRNPVDGSIWNDGTYSLGGSPMKGCARVVWFQPYEDKVNFETPGVILPTEIINGLSTVQPVWP